MRVCGCGLCYWRAHNSRILPFIQFYYLNEMGVYNHSGPCPPGRGNNYLGAVSKPDQTGVHYLDVHMSNCGV